MSNLLNDMDAYNRVKAAIAARVGTLPESPPSYTDPNGNSVYADTYGALQKAMSLVLADDLTKEEYKRVIRMLYSADLESQLLAEIVINQKIKQL